jgi:2-oxoglutarate dehydrogenase E1 component (EC 1.2.4.2)
MTGERYQALLQTTPLQGANAAWIEALYEAFLTDPASVGEDWRSCFSTLHAEANGGTEWALSAVRERFERLRGEPPALPAAAPSEPRDANMLARQAAVLRLINYHRVRGHQLASLDPLGLSRQPPLADLDPRFHGLDDSQLDTLFDVGSLAVNEPRMTLRDILSTLRTVYTGSIGAQYMYLNETEEKRWIQRRLEGSAFKERLGHDAKLETLRQLIAAEGIERYLHTRYVGQKRFSLEGAESLIPALDELMRVNARAGVEEMLIGMAHRGRLNVLVNVLGKKPSDLFAEFEGKFAAETVGRAGDVKYHLGFSNDVEIDGHRLHLALAFNPSHLEIVDPVVEGSAKARQHRRNDEGGRLVVPVLIHGDASFAGQGVVMETLQLADAKGYATGGTVHIVVNNQLGFTTPNPILVRPGKSARSSRYCTDIAKMLEAPVFHVNGDDPEAVVFIARLAADFRNTFRKDVFIDLCCYRRHGHNEADEPAVTQPVMYGAIRRHPTTLAIYGRRLTEEGLLADGEMESLSTAYRDGLDRGENIARNTLGMVGNRYTVDWSSYRMGAWDDPCDTAVDADTLADLSRRLLSFPEGFSLHPRVARIMEDRVKMAAGELPIDWGYAETLAYATLLHEGASVRLSGQDTRRGTFFHRHASVYDTVTESTYTPLKHLDPDKNRFVVNDTLLSEEGVLAFEYGYATTDPDCLVIWEAQYGDFANGAQVVVDQFIASGMVKWGRYCGLTLLLPHGFEGAGPEHSSARLERYLQLCAGNNMQVCVPSTPAQLFHVLRRQIRRPLRLPLVVMSPKSLLRHKQSVSTLEA